MAVKFRLVLIIRIEVAQQEMDDVGQAGAGRENPPYWHVHWQ